MYFSKYCSHQLLNNSLMIIQAGALFDWINDARHFLLEHFDTIHKSPSQIYHSALPSCPSSSWLRKCYSSGFLNEVEIVRGLPTEWGPCSRTISLDAVPLAISCWNTNVAVGLTSGGIVILKTATGSQRAFLFGHRGQVSSVTFSLDGTLLASGSYDKTIKLWDVQTGGVVKTFSGHGYRVSSVSISTDNVMIASGSGGKTTHLWNVQTGARHQVGKQTDSVDHVSFLPMSSQNFISISDNKIQQWDISGHQIEPEYTGHHIAFSLDGIKLALCNNSAITIQDTKSGADIAKFHVISGTAQHCCFSPDGSLIGASVDSTAYVWNITSPDPHPIHTFTGHSDDINALAFSSSSSLISVSSDKSVKFWQIGTSSTVSVETGSPTCHLAQAMSVTLQVGQGIIITSDSNGVVRILDILTGTCKKSVQTPLQKSYKRDIQLIDGRLTVVWYTEGKIHIWDAEKKKLLFEVIGPHFQVLNPKISGDGSKVFCLDGDFIRAWSIWTGQEITKVTLKNPLFVRFLTVEGSRVWTYNYQSEWEGWDFKFPDSPIQLSKQHPCILHPDNTILWDIGQSRIQDIASRKVLFQLSVGLGMPVNVGWYGRHFVACFESGEVLVLDLGNVLPQ